MRAEVVGVKGLAVAIGGPQASDGLVGERHRGLVVAGALGEREGKPHSWVRSSGLPCFWASFAASSADRAPWMSKVRR